LLESIFCTILFKKEVEHSPIHAAYRWSLENRMGSFAKPFNKGKEDGMERLTGVILLALFACLVLGGTIRAHPPFVWIPVDPTEAAIVDFLTNVSNEAKRISTPFLRQPGPLPL
jgi:hypothetical protein